MRALVHNTGVVFNALAGRDHQLEGLIVNGEHTFHAAAEASQAFAETFRALPAFEHNSTVALKELDSFAAVASPFLEEFRPAERQLALLLQTAKPFAPRSTGSSPRRTADQAAKRACRTQEGARADGPVLENLRPVLHNFDPFLQYLGEYVPELQAFFANVTAATRGDTETTPTPADRRAQSTICARCRCSARRASRSTQRIGTDRANPYFQPGAFSSLASGLPVFSQPLRELGAVGERAGERNDLRRTHRTADPVPSRQRAGNAPTTSRRRRCIQQGPFTFNGQTSQFPHVVYEAPSK